MFGGSKTARLMDRVATRVMRKRLKLPAIDLSVLFEDFDELPVTFRSLPRGSWSTPLTDIVQLLKIVACARSKRLLEVGSYRGFTALVMAQHIADDARLVAVDSYAEHGEAYRDTQWAAKIERRVGVMSSAIFADDAAASYDFIFVDADHAYANVRNDTELTLPLLAPTGYLVWHDYANWGYWSDTNRVPEYLNSLAERLPLARIPNSSLAVYSPLWAGPHEQRFLRATAQTGAQAEHWTSNSMRG